MQLRRLDEEPELLGQGIRAGRQAVKHDARILQPADQRNLRDPGMGTQVGGSPFHRVHEGVPGSPRHVLQLRRDQLRPVPEVLQEGHGFRYH